MRKISLLMLVIMLLTGVRPIVNTYAKEVFTTDQEIRQLKSLEEITNTEILSKTLEMPEETTNQIGEEVEEIEATQEVEEIETTQEVEEIETTQEVEEIETTQEVEEIETTQEVEEIETTQEVELSLDIIDYNQKQRAVNQTTYAVQNVDKSNETNVSVAQDNAKIKAKAGEQVIQIKGTKADSIEHYSITSSGDILSSEIKSNDVVNQISVLNGEIISTDKGIIQTLGGYESVLYAYNTLEEAEKQLNGVSFSGGAFDGEYLGTEEYNGSYYVKTLISGMEGYIAIDDLQIIPSSLIQSQSHYENVGGIWVYYEAINPLVSDVYEAFPIGDAPEWSQEGMQYYSYDNENYSENNINTSRNSTREYYTYFQNLPFTSTANYTAGQYKNYLAHEGYTNSKYYNATSGFIEAQNLESINSLILFAMANHEGAYGTSYFSTKCNNFFGYGAVDSNPDDACKSYGYNTPRDGILAQALHLTQMWGDISDWRFGGTEPGNKSHGINVTYASDSNWGIKVASHAYSVDSYLGGKENNKYRIYEIKNSEPTYINYGTTLKVDSSSKNYVIPRSQGNPRVIVTKEQGDAFEYQLPTPKNVSSSTTCKSTDASKGSYPNYGGLHSRTVPKGVGSFACDYDDFSVQREWYPKKDASGNITYNVVANNPITLPGSTTSQIRVCTKTTVNNSTMFRQVSEDGKNTCTTYFNSNHQRTKYTERTISDGETIYYREDLYPNGGTRSKRSEWWYYNSGIKRKKIEYIYSSTNGSKVKSKKMYSYKSNYTSSNKISSKTYYYYYDNGNVKNKDYTVYQSNGYKKYRSYKTYNSSKKLTNIKEYWYQSGKLYKSLEDKYDSSYKTNRRVTYYRTNGKITEDYKYTFFSNGVVKQREYSLYNSKGKITKKQYSKRYSNNKVWQLTNYYYNTPGSRIKREDVNYKNGIKYAMNTYKYNSAGNKYYVSTKHF